MLGTRFYAAVAIALIGLLLPDTGAASERPTLISHVTSPPVRDMPSTAHHGGRLEEKERPHKPLHRGSGNVVDPVVQTFTTGAAAAQALGQWEGLGAGYPGFTLLALPPDPNIAVGPNHIVQFVNNAFMVFNKSGAPLMQAPVSDETFWGSLNGTCDQLGGFSDPIVQYDRVANRWVVGEIAIPLLPGLLGQFAQCFAVSTTSDPTGPYNMWAYGFNNTIPDYPKIGMWPDGYYVTWNMFPGGGASFSGPEACAWNRVDMLNGVHAPRFVCFQLSSAYASLLPSDVDGPTQPPPGSPNYLMNIDPASSTLSLWKFHVDWAIPANSTFAGPISVPGTAPFQGPCIDNGDCIPQPGTAQKLDALGDRLMYRLAYRNFGDHESIVANHTVIADAGNTGVRWYEVRNPNGTPTIYQQGTFAPDTDNRWMASIAMDHSGNIGVGYTVASAGTFPSIRYSGWEVGDPLGTLQAETSLVSGGGSQTAYNRWGDYSAMRIDPSDDCTFWYTQEYQATTADANWNTRIGSFKFPSCGQSQTSTTTTVTSSLPTSTFGQSVTFTASVSPSAATGNVQFFDGGNSLGTIPLSGGSASLTTASLTAGTHSITASYGGDANFASGTSSAMTQAVNQASTTTALTSSLNTSTFGQAVTFTATVSPALGPTGTVQFFDGATSLGTVALSAGNASLTTATLTAGAPHSITASYSGNANYAGSPSSAVTQTVNQASTATALTSSLDPSLFGQAVTFTATVNPTSGPAGTVQFFDGLNSLGTVPLSGVTASFTTSTLAVGTHFITAAYSGDTNFTGSTSASVTQTISASTISTTTTLTSPLNPSTYGQQVTFSATVSPSSGATGSVTFMDGGVLLGTSSLNASGVATFSTSALAVGTHSITAQYSGDGIHTGSMSSTLSQTVNRAGTTITLTSSDNPSRSGRPVTFTATVSPSTAPGTVEFFDGSSSLGTASLVSGQASISTSSLSAAKHSITAVYSGNANFEGSTSAVLAQNVTGKK
jgi:Big-like domain-containing protein